MLEDKAKQHRQVVDKYHSPNADYEMTTRDYVLRPYANGDSGAITVNLPPVSEAEGRFYSIICRGADAVNTVTIADLDDSECWHGDIVMDGKCDRALMYSDGLAWHAFGNQAAWPGISTTRAAGTTPTPTTEAPTAAPTTDIQ